jgi:NitT/TauT family transport system permease protein
MAIGYACASILGIGLGLLVGRFRWLDSVLGASAAALNAMPGAAWVPLAVFLFGLTQGAVIFTIVLGATGIVMLNTYSGIQAVPPLLLRAARTMGARGLKIFLYVILPASIPRVVEGLRLAWAFGWRALMAGELLITSIHGLGQLINEVARQRNIEQLLAFMAIIALIGMAVDGIFFNRIVGDRLRARWGAA